MANTVPKTYTELLLLNEIERALDSDNTELLGALDRIREAANLPRDPRVAARLRQQLVRAVTMEPAR